MHLVATAAQLEVSVQVHHPRPNALQESHQIQIQESAYWDHQVNLWTNMEQLWVLRHYQVLTSGLLKVILRRETARLARIAMEQAPSSIVLWAHIALRALLQSIWPHLEALFRTRQGFGMSLHAQQAMYAQPIHKQEVKLVPDITLLPESLPIVSTPVLLAMIAL